MRKIYLFAMALAVLMSLTSCGKSKINKIINEANLMTVNEDFDNALALCDELYENKLENVKITGFDNCALLQKFPLNIDSVDFDRSELINTIYAFLSGNSDSKTGLVPHKIVSYKA